jgi:hypothetical protein
MCNYQKLRKKESMCFKMELYIKVSGRVTKGTDMGSNSGQMVQDMKDIGKITKLMAKACFIMLMEIYSKVNGKTIKQMAMVYTNTLMELGMRGTG